MATRKTQTRKTRSVKNGSRRPARVAETAGTLHIRGRILRSNGSPFSGVTAIAFDKDVAGVNVLGRSVASADGTFEIAYTDAQFRRSKSERGAADVFLRVYDGEKLIAETKVVRSAPPELTLDVSVPAMKFVVRGTVKHSDGVPAAGVLVRAFDRDLRKESALGSTVADALGRYEIPYESGLFARADRDTADLIVRVFADEASVSPIAESELRVNAGEDATIDIAIAANALSEWERITNAVLPLLEGQGKDDGALPPWELNEGDIAFIADETELPADQIALWVLAVKTLREQQVTMRDTGAGSSLTKYTTHALPDVQSGGAALMVLLYGWFRDGQPQVFAELLQRLNDTLIESAERAVAQSYIPALGKALLEQVSAILNTLRGSQQLKPSSDPEMTASLGDALRLLPDADRLQLDTPDGPGARLATLLANASPAAPPSWEERLNAVGDEHLLRSAQRSIGLHSLTGGFAPWIRELQRGASEDTDPTLADLVSRDAADWIEFARKHGVPKNVAGATDDERFTSYGRQFAIQLQQMHPTRFVQERIASDRIPVNPEAKGSIAKFLSGNPAFRLKQTPVLAYTASADFNDGGLNEKALTAVSTELMKIERVATLVPLLDYVGPLLSASYDSARSIVHRRSRSAFVTEMRDSVGDDAHAGEIYDAAAGAAANADALVLRHGAPFRGPDLPVMPLEGRAGQARMRRNAAGANDIVLPANLQQLFGNQDYCECAHGASLYGAAAYLADLLRMLGSAQRTDGKTPLDVLLARRPDLAEVDLTGDNTNITLQYIDLVLEILEQPDWMAGNGFRVRRGGTRQNPNNDFDALLDQGIVPAGIADDLAYHDLPLGEQRTADAGVDVPWPGGRMLKSWLVRDAQSGMKVRLVGTTYGVFRIMVYPQSVAGMPKGYRPWSTALSAIAASTSSARFPWSLPFDVNRDEANAWLKWLGASREELLLALTSTARWTSVDAACEHAGLNPATRAIFTAAPSATRPDHADWGFANPNVGAEGITDPVAGMSGTLGGGVINWDGAQARPPDPPAWFALLRNVSLIRSRTQLSHRELQNVLAMRFVLAGAAQLNITGPECDTALMRLDAMDAALARRMHLFVRLQRLLGWNFADVDAALRGRAAFVAGAGSNVVLSPDCLRFIGNIARLSARARMSASVCMDLFSSGTLDTASYWNYDGAQPVRTLSRYEAWFDNGALDRGRLPEFRLNDTRDALVATTAPDAGLPRLRIIDHSTYIAAALGIPESEVSALLPVGIGMLPPTNVAAATTSTPIRVGSDADIVVEALLGALSDGATFSLTLQDSDDGAAFQNVAANELSVQTPWLIGAATPLLSRFTYTGRKPYLRLSIASTAGANPSLWIGVRALRTVGTLGDELTLASLTTLCKYGVLRRLIARPMSDVLTLLDLTGLDPFAANAGPELVLELMEARDALAALGYSIAEADRLLRGPIGTAADTLDKQASALLTAARAAHLAVLNESTVSLDQRSVLLSKVFTDFGWDSRYIANVLSAAHLGVSWDDYITPLDALPGGTQLPAGVTYEQRLQRLVARVTIRPATLRTDLAPAIAAAAPGALKVALQALDAQAQSRETELALLQTLLRETTPHTFETNWALPANVSLTLPAEWKGRFYYERALGKLRFVGWMSPQDQAALLTLEPSLNVGTSVPTFAAAVNDLFAQSGQYAPAAANRLAVRQGTAGLTIEALLLDTGGLEDRSGLILDRLLPDWRLARLRSKCADALAQIGNTTADIADALLSLVVTVASPGPLTEKTGFEWFASDTRLLASDPVTETPRAAYPQTFDAATQLLVLSQVAARVSLDASQVSWLRSTWTGLELKQLPTSRVANVRAELWSSLLALSRLSGLKKHPLVEDSVLASLRLAAQSPAIDFPQLAKILSATEANVRALAAASGLNIDSPAWLRDPSHLSQLIACLDLCKEMKVPASLLVSAARAQSVSRPARDAENEAQALRQVAVGQTPGGNWPDEENTVLDEIRQRRRDAVVDYLVQLRGVRDSNDIYGYYLIDADMGPCMATSRIVQAISSVQLFIQRCFMALEPAAPAASLDKRHWEWMKNYRVWEANRKVLLYAENWIAPELRDDKTPFFDEVISALQQGDVASDRAERAVETFLEKLTDFSHMDVVATCADYDENNRLLGTYLFARTPSEPRTYYYRHFRNLNPGDNSNALGAWTGWKPLALDIEGDHLFPVIWQGRLFLFWAIFSKEAEEPTEAQLALAQTRPVPSEKYWLLKLAWSEYKSGAWSSRRIAQDDLMGVKIFAAVPKPTAHTAVQNPAHFYFTAVARDEGITITGLYSPQPTKYYIEYRPFTTLFFDGQRPVRAEGTYKYLGQPWRTSYRFDQTAEQEAEAPADDAVLGRIPPHLKMAIHGYYDWPMSLEKPGGWLTVFPKIRRNLKLIFSPRTTCEMFSAPGAIFAPLPIPEGSMATPFTIADRAHQFFVYPTWQQHTSVVFTNIAGNFGVMFMISEAPKLHFYALDWIQSARLRKSLASKGISGLLSFESQDNTRHPPLQYFNEYGVPAEVVSAYPDGDIEFGATDPSSTYNYELFFHVPFAVACALSKNRRFAEARQWFHYIFDPTDTSDDPAPSRYWRFRPFRESQDLPIGELVRRLADRTDQSSAKQEFQALIRQWKDDPFKPHLVARLRLRSYMYAVVMAYLDNLIDWADQLFRRDTMESLNEATQLYVLASQILGRRPESVPHRTRPTVHAYAELATLPPDDLSNALVEAENLVSGVSTGGSSSAGTPLQSLYFCVPNNPKIGSYYDRVEGQLYKLRNCMNIDGVVRELPLFAPEIDPGLLVRAAAAGVDIASALADLQAPLPLYRFSVMTQKASELCAEVKSLGSALLSAIEKADGEALGRLRSGHELSLLGAVRLVKETQLQEAKSNLDALGDQMQAAQTRFAHYVGLVSQLEPLSIPSGPVAGTTVQDLAAAALETLTTAAAFAQAVTPKIDPFATASMELLKQTLSRASLALAATLPPENADTANVPMNDAEKKQLQELKSGHDLQNRAADQRVLAQALAMIPDFTLGAQGFASSPVVQFQLGGTLLSKVANFAASITDSKASEHSYRATLHSILAGYQRRAADWLLQAQLASVEIAQLGNQIKASTLRIAIASQELRNHDLQVRNALEADEFMRSKFTNQELFTWMSGQLSSLYFQAYQLAYDVAKRAERCFAHELGSDTTFLQFGYWDGLKKGLLAGEMLHADIRRMEVAYLNQNVRELEITKHVSLLMLDSTALVRLRETGECEFAVPEVLYDLDFPGHYFRRIKSVSVSVPCVAGPYTSLSSTLTLLSSTLRVRSMPANQSYLDEQNFRRSALPTQSIATSTGQGDSGMFELNFRDDRYLPFEGAGAISRWRLTMPQTLRPFDYSTITDVVLHVRYTARDAGGLLKRAAQDSLIGSVNALGANNGFNRLFSLKQDFPAEWYRFAKTAGAQDPRSEELALSLRRFPFLFTGKGTALSITSLAIFVMPSSAAARRVPLPDTLRVAEPHAAANVVLQPVGDVSIGPLLGKAFAANAVRVTEKDEDAKWKLILPAADASVFEEDVEDLLIVINYSLAAV